MKRIWGQEGRTLESLTLVQIDAPCSHTSKSSSLANELLICILFCTQTLGLLGKVHLPPALNFDTSLLSVLKIFGPTTLFPSPNSNLEF